MGACNQLCLAASLSGFHDEFFFQTGCVVENAGHFCLDSAAVIMCHVH